jgi:Fic family protein
MNELLESPGEYRRIQILIEKAEHEPPPTFEVPELMNDLIKWYKQNKTKIHPFELAVLLHTKFVTIHPFVDGDGRVARALLNFILERNDYPELYLGLEDRNAYLDAVAQGKKATEQGIEIDQILNDIEYLKSNGQIYEYRTGKIRSTL